MEARDKILAAMKQAGKPLKSAEIAEISGVDKKDTDKTIKALMNEEKVFSPKKCFYQAK